MTVSIRQVAPVAHLPLVLGMLRKLEVAQLIDTLIPPNPAHVVSCGRGVEALVLAILDGHHVLYKVGHRLEQRGMLPLLQAMPDPNDVSAAFLRAKQATEDGRAALLEFITNEEQLMFKGFGTGELNFKYL